MRDIRRLIVLPLFGLLASAAEYQQPPDPRGGSFDSNGSSITWADDFQFAESTTIRALSWWGHDNGPRSGPDLFSVRLFTDAAGRPGVPIPEFVTGSITKTAAGVDPLGPYPQWQYSTVLIMPFEAQSGLRYWLSIANPPAGSWSWQASDNQMNLGTRLSIGGGLWEARGSNTAFELLSIPEPTGILLFLLGLCGFPLVLRVRVARKTHAKNDDGPTAHRRR